MGVVAADYLKPLFLRSKADAGMMLRRLIETIVRRELELKGAKPDKGRVPLEQAMCDFAEAIAKANVAAGMLGALDLGREINAASPDRVKIPQKFSEDPVEAMAFDDPTFNEALRQFERRFPVLGETAKALAKEYSPERLFWVSEAASLAVTKTVKKAVEKALDAGTTFEDFEKMVRRMEEQTATWANHYLETVFRNNLSSAYHQGRIEQAKSPELKGWVVGWEYYNPKDASSRKNHAAASGYVWSVDDADTAKVMKVPRGHRCRCMWRMITKPEAESDGVADKLARRAILKRSGNGFREVKAVESPALPTPEEATFIGG